MNSVKAKLKDIAIVKNGSTPSTSNSEFYDGEIVWITPKDLSNQNTRYIVKGERTITKAGFDSCSASMVPKGTVLLSSRAPIGLLSIAATELCTNQGFKNIIPDKSKIDSEFLYYYLKIKIADIDKLGSGTTFKEISKSSIEDFQLLIPREVKSQQKIASVLSTLDSKIELNNRINAELEAMAKTLYDYWFVQFDFPNKNGKPYKTSGGKMVWNEELKREIPEGWKVKRLDEIADLKAGGDRPKNYSEIQTDTHQIPIFSNGITNDGLYGFTDEAKILKPSITVSARGTIGYCVLRNKPFVPIIRLIVVTPNSTYEAKFLYERIKSMEFDNSGSVQQQLTVPQISGVKVVMPTSEILKKYYTLTSSGMKNIEINKEENQKLSELRDWLLPMLMNGQVKVK